MNPTIARTSDARIQRRILTSGRNGVFRYQASLAEPFGPTLSPSTEQCPVPLWPPTDGTTVGGCTYASAVSPASDAPGLLDQELGITNLSFLELQSLFAACLLSVLGGSL